MNPVHAVDPLLKEQDPHLLHLSVLLMQNGLSFSVLDPKSGILLAEVNHPFFPGEQVDQALHRIWAADHLLQLPFKETKVSWFDTHFTVVPHAFVTSDVGKLLSIEHPQAEHILIHPLGTDAVVLQAMDNALSSWISKHLPEAKLISWIGNWIEQENHTLAFFTQAGITGVMVKKDSSLEFAQVYPTATPEDQLYYLLFALEQLHINSRDAAAVVSGTNHQDLAKILSDYIPNIQPAQLNGLQPAPALVGLDLNWHLHALHLCASSVAD